MSKTIRYQGTQRRWPELAVTGKQNTWSPGWIDTRDDGEAGQLLATGLFAVVQETLSAAQVAAVAELLQKPIVPYRPGVPLLAFPRSAGDHGTVVSYGTGAGTPTVSYETVDGIPVMRVTALLGTAASPGAHVNLNAFSRGLPNGRLRVLARPVDPENLSAVAAWIGYGGTGYDNAYSASRNNTHYWEGWSEWVINPPWEGAWSGLTTTHSSDQLKWAVGAGAPNMASDTYTAARLRIVGATGVASCSVDIAGVWVDDSHEKPAIVFTFDDGRLTSYNVGLPIAEQYGIRVSQGIIAAGVGIANRVTLENLRDSVSRGHECVVHGNPPTGALTGYTTEAEIRADVAENRDFLLANGLSTNNSHKVYVYPQGAWRHALGDTRIINALTAEGFIAARLNSRRQGTIVTPLSRLNPLAIYTVGHTYNGTDEAGNVAQVILRMQQNAALGRSSVLTFHEVKDTPTLGDEISPANFKAICAAAAELFASGAARPMLLSEMVADVYSARA